MKLVYKLQAEEYKYEIPVNYLPVRTFLLSITAYTFHVCILISLLNIVALILSLFVCPEGTCEGFHPARGPPRLSTVPQQAAVSPVWSADPEPGSQYPSQHRH